MNRAGDRCDDFRGAMHNNSRRGCSFSFSACYACSCAIKSSAACDKKIHVICRREFRHPLPDDIRKLGPWQSLKRGDVEPLKTHYRLQLAEQGFVVVHQSMGTFSPNQLNPDMRS